MISKARPSITSANPVIYVVLTIAAVAALIPFIWMLMTSVKTFGDTLSLTIWPWPPFGKSEPQFNNFGDAIRQIGVDRETGLPLFVRQFLNTSFVTAVIVVGVTTTSIMAAYAFANLEFPGKRVIFLVVLLTLMFPDDLTLIPRAVMMFKNYLDWYDSYLALTIPFIASAFGIFLVRQFMMQIPADLFDAAQIDGAGHIRYLTQIVIEYEPYCRKDIELNAPFCVLGDSSGFD